METNRIRQEAGIVYWVIGLAVLLVFLGLKICGKASIILITLLWCCGWSAIGIGAGLINTRKHNKSKLDRARKHYYFLYYPLVFLMIFLAALSGAFSINDGILKLEPQFYSVIPLICLVAGIYAENFGALARTILNKLR